MTTNLLWGFELTNLARGFSDVFGPILARCCAVCDPYRELSNPDRELSNPGWRELQGDQKGLIEVCRMDSG